MIINEKAKELLDKLRTPNYRQMPDFGLDSVSETLMEIISNECKSTMLTTDDNGNMQSRRYGSDIIKENTLPIIRQLIINGGTIPKEVMNKIMYSNGMIMGVDSDIQLYKGIQEREDGSMETTATMGNAVIDFRTLDADTLNMIGQEVYNRYARQFVLANSKQLPQTSKFSLFKEKMLHGREDRDFIAKKFADVLKSQTEYSDEIIASTVQYHLDHMYNSRFTNSILETMNSGQSLVEIGSKGKNIPFEQLQEAIFAETQDIENTIPNINQIHGDIEQLYADVEAQLIGYSADITSLEAPQIEENIKEINRASLKDPNLQKHIGESGYRNVNVGISNNSVKLVQFQSVPQGMQKLSKDIYELVQNADSMGQEEYLKRAVQLQYRFIRIHPFTDSNGRTSRALLNMMTIPKGMLIEVPKEKKSAFVQAQRDTNEQLDSQGYYEALNFNLNDLDLIEAENMDLPTYNFIRRNCVLQVNQQNSLQDNEQQHIVQAEVTEELQQ